jgi:hypothetical protein
VPADVSLRVKNELSREQGATSKIASELRRGNRKKLNVYARWMDSSKGGAEVAQLPNTSRGAAAPALAAEAS